MKTFWAAVKDPGGWNAVVPIVLLLRKLGHKVLLITNGKANQLAQAAGLEHVPCESAKEIMGVYGLPDLFLTSMCSNGGIGRNLIYWLRQAGVPTVAIQDSWGARLYKPDEWGLLRDRPQYIVVNDEVGAQLVQQAWPEFNPKRIKQLGYAAHDKYADIDVKALTEAARQKLGLPSDNRPVILYGGQLDYTGRVLGELVDGLNTIGRSVTLIARPHPRMALDAPQEAEAWTTALEKFNCGRLITDSSSCTPQEIICLAGRSQGAVISIFSTMMVEAACLGIPAISLLFPETGRKAYKEASDGQIAEYPLVALGCCEAATNQVELQTLLEQLFIAGDLGLQIRQKTVFQPDGRNAERIGNFILSLVK